MEQTIEKKITRFESSELGQLQALVNHLNKRVDDGMSSFESIVYIVHHSPCHVNFRMDGEMGKYGYWLVMEYERMGAFDNTNAELVANLAQAFVFGWAQSKHHSKRVQEQAEVNRICNEIFK